MSMHSAFICPHSNPRAFRDIEEGNLYDALMGGGTGNDTLRSLLCNMVEDLESYAECLDSTNLARERRSTLLDPKEDLPSFIEKLTSVLQKEGKPSSPLAPLFHFFSSPIRFLSSSLALLFSFSFFSRIRFFRPSAGPRGGRSANFIFALI